MRTPVYPWLLGLFPLLHLYSENLGIVTHGPVPVAIAASLALTTLLFLLARLLTGSAHRAGLVTAALLLGFYSYGHLVTLLDEAGRDSWQPMLLPAVAFATTALAWIARRLPPATDLGPVNAGLNVATAALLVVPVLTVASFWSRNLSRDASALATLTPRPVRAEKLPDGPDRPDIYYIIPDGYSSNAHYLRDWGYDNSAFTDALEELGFYVAYDSKSNYGATLLSAASVLNMRYLPEKPAEVEIADLVYLRSLIADSDVAHFLIERGYSYSFVLSGFLLPSTIADVNIDFGPNGPLEFDLRAVRSNAHELDQGALMDGGFYREPFSKALADTTLLRMFSGKLAPLSRGNRPYSWDEISRFFGAIERLKKIAQMPEATFTFVDLMKPHGPVQVARNGRKLTKRPTPKDFFGELEYFNQWYLRLLRALIEGSPTPPIIIFQADHGTNLGYVWTPDHHLTHFEILNALYLPGEKAPALEPDVSPVNVFGLLFESYFGLEYEPQEARQFDVPAGYDAPFDQVDVTAEFR